ncbi:MAG: hypothetical protein SPH30_05825 [Prevotella sp.]|nr:hypothetical protein [Prevotella sp.]
MNKEKQKNELIQRLIKAKADQSLIDLYSNNFDRMHFETEEDFQDWEEALMLDIANHQKMSPSRQGNSGDFSSPEVRAYNEQQAAKEANAHYSTMITTGTNPETGTISIITK